MAIHSLQKTGDYRVEVWPVPEGLDLSVTLPNGEVMPCRYTQGKLLSLFIGRVEECGTHADLTMTKSIPLPLNSEIREVAMKAVNEHLAQYDPTPCSTG
jgi:hypothetical protein